MHKLTLEHFFRRVALQTQQQCKREEEIGLFTFYKQQEQSENSIRSHFPHKKKQSLRYSKTKPQFKLTKYKQPVKQQQGSQKQTPRNVTENAISFVKNIEKNMQKSQITIKDPIAVDKKIENGKTASKVQDQTHVAQSMGEQEPSQIKRYNMVLNPQNEFIPRPLKRVQQLLNISDLKLDSNQQKHSENHDYLIKGETKIKKNPRKQQTNSIPHTFDQSQSYLRQICKPSLTQQSCQDISQRSFLKNAREKSETVQILQKPVRNSKTIDNLHKQNQKYFCNLISNFYLPHNQTSQAAKILRETLKFPNLYTKLKTYNIKTEGNLTPPSIKRIEPRSKSCKRDFQCRLKNRNKDSNQIIPNGSVNPISNQRLKLLFKRDASFKG